MNRAERRKNQVEKQEKTYTLKDSDIEEIKRQTMKKASRFAFEYAVGIPLLVLRDEFGFGRKRCEKFYEAASVLMDSMDKELLTIEDIRETLEKELDVKLIPGRVRL